MFRIPPCFSAGALVILMGLASALATPVDKRLVVVGSSVPKGQGAYSAGTYYGDDVDGDGSADFFATYGYAGRLKRLVEAEGWSFDNQSIAGNTTAAVNGRFDPDVTDENPEYVLIGLSLGNEGLAGNSDPDGVLETFSTGLQAIIARARDAGSYPVVSLVYPRGNYSRREYAFVKRMNLRINSWGVPCINLLGALDDGRGRWAGGFAYDNGHPNVLGHQELYYAIVPTLFEAIEAGATEVPTYPSSEGFARVDADTSDPAPLVFTPESPLHAFTSSFRVRSSTAGTVAAVGTRTRPLFLVDFGPSNDDDGRATDGPDSSGLYWNSWRPVVGGSVAIAAGTRLENLVTVDHEASAVSLEITDAFSGANGRLNGGLNDPDATLLGLLAQPTATEDYFYETGTAGFRISGLDPAKTYSLRLFGSRSTTQTRETRFSVSGALPYTPFTDLVTSGDGLGSDGLYDGNDALIGLVNGVPPSDAGEITVTLSIDAGSYAYLNALEIIEEDAAATAYGTVELRDGAIAYVSPRGEEITSPVNGVDGGWHDIALSHRYAQQETLLYVDGVLAGTLRENYVPAFFVLGGPAGADERADAPAHADYQDWCVVRAAWTPEEALAQSQGQLQHASLEICAPLDDASFIRAGTVESWAQSLSTVEVRSGAVTAGVAVTPPGSLAAVSYAFDTAILAWEDNSSTENGFVLERRGAGENQPWEKIATFAAHVTTATDHSLSAGESYAYRVASIEADGLSSYSNIAWVGAGQDGRSYRDWSTAAFALPPRTYRIDFNTASDPDYGGQVWNQINRLGSGGPYPLVDAEGDGTDAISLTVLSPFAAFRGGNGSPLAGVAAAPQESGFTVSDQTQTDPARVRLSGLNPDAVYQLRLFGRRGNLTSGYDYSGRYTVEHGGRTVSFEMNSAEADAPVDVFNLRPDAAGTITLSVAGPDDPAGTVMAVLSFLEVEELSAPGAFLVDFDAKGDKAVYGEGEHWTTISACADTSTLYPLADASGDMGAGVTLRLTRAFSQTRENDRSPPGHGVSAEAERTLFKASTAAGGSSLTIGGLDTNRAYRVVILARRGYVVSGFDYSGVYTLSGAASRTVTVDAADNETFTAFDEMFPGPGGELTLTVEAGPDAGTDFPVLNLLMVIPGDYASGSEPASARSDDPEGDGSSNFMEYVLGSDPLVASPARRDLLSVGTGTDGVIRLSYEQNLMAREVNYTLERTDDLADPASWQAFNPPAGQATLSESGRMALELDWSLDADTTFFRLKIE